MNSLHKFFLSTITTLSLTTLVQQVHADQLADIQQKGEIVIGVLGTAEPFSFIDPKTRELVGYEIDIGKDLAQALGVKPVFKQLAVAARIPELQQGHVDILAAALAITPDRQEQIDFSIPTLITGQKILVSKQSGISGIAQLEGKKLVTIKGGTQEANAKKAIAQANVVSFDNAPQAFLALQQGKAEGMVDDESGLVGVLNKAGSKAENFTILPERISTTQVAIGIKKHEPALLAAINSALLQAETRGEAGKWFFQWYGPTTQHGFSERDFTWSAPN
ncbi:transporter substrate-binding domain-containing protein [Lampropedia puyangensis]|uniref:Transporter substrate-binding domain-containing protein n=2 Tax=Lampropedia puyangensis TaxID=1330072 RepID=A0A4S8F4N3_9BURK|nr:transporter substrate-binding domain-containing protein [Lampropedia puyangensis]THU01989.1 transporter substrate-binding domain-containing protein [Lampropedia puyangensis]